MIRKREQFKIPVLDIRRNTGVGISYPFGNQPVIKVNYSTKNQTKSNLLCFMMTNVGERPFNPLFGADIRRYVFEQMTSTDELREIILDKLGLYFPEISVNSLEFDLRPDENTIIISLNYFINREEDNLTLQLV